MSPEQLLAAGANAAAKWPPLNDSEVDEITRALGADGQRLWEPETANDEGREAA